MAKEDFCFTYYDGDASKDVAHMNRLERGCYLDILHAQRKRGHLSVDDIKRVLGKDFTDCWASLEWVMKKDSAGKFFIEWLELSLEKMKLHSAKQSQNAAKRYQTDAKPIPKDNLAIPLEDGNGYKDEYVNGSGKEEGGTGETKIVPAMVKEFKENFPKYFIQKNQDSAAVKEIAEKICGWCSLDGGIVSNQEPILRRWGEIITHIKTDKHFLKYSISQINTHFQSITQSLSNASSSPKNTKSGFTENARKFVNPGG